MKWGRKKNPIKPPSSSHSSSSSSSSSSNIFSSILHLSSWLPKLRLHSKHNPIHNKHRPAAPTPAPTPKSSPPPSLAPTRTHSDVTVPRRLSVGDDDSHLARSRTLSFHRPSQSLGSNLDFLLDLPRPRRPRRPRPDPRPVKTAPSSDPDPIRTGRRSFGGGRIRPRVRVYSPRLARPNPGRRLESFAVVKSSSDPVKDFRESMVEMIWEKGIGRPEELESLLACYLSLNSDEHHDVIVKVFRQVWFDLSREMGPARHLVP